MVYLLGLSTPWSLDLRILTVVVFSNFLCSLVREETDTLIIRYKYKYLEWAEGNGGMIQFWISKAKQKNLKNQNKGAFFAFQVWISSSWEHCYSPSIIALCCGFTLLLIRSGIFLSTSCTCCFHCPRGSHSPSLSVHTYHAHTLSLPSVAI